MHITLAHSLLVLCLKHIEPDLLDTVPWWGWGTCRAPAHPDPHSLASSAPFLRAGIMPCFPPTWPGRSQRLRNGLLKQPDMKPRTYKTQINYALWRSCHSTPTPMLSRPDSAHRSLICLTLPEHASGNDQDISESLLHVFQGGHSLAPISACTRPAVRPGTWPWL